MNLSLLEAIVTLLENLIPSITTFLQNEFPSSNATSLVTRLNNAVTSITAVVPVNPDNNATHS